MTSNIGLRFELETRTCRRCSKSFTPVHRFSSACLPCAEILHAEQQQQAAEEKAAAIAAERRDRWEELCPPLYRQSDLARLPAALLAAVAEYQFGAKGLGFVGESGLGKTRAMMLLCRQLIVDEGRHGQYVTGTAFSREVADRGHEMGKYAAKLSRAPFLFLDDIGKGKLTDAVQAHLHDVLEERTAHLRPTLWTSNAGGGELAAMFTADHREPFLRRLASSEFSTIVRL